jgi:hypothetical protein
MLYLVSKQVYYVLDEEGSFSLRGLGKDRYKEAKDMKKILLALLVLVSAIGFALAQPACVDCYANIITQNDNQNLQNTQIGCDNDNVYNEAASAAIILTPAFDPTLQSYGNVVDGFARVDQVVDQDLLNVDLDATSGTSVYNTAIQAAWVEGQGRKELFPPTPVYGETQEWAKEGAYVSQATTQIANLVDINAGSGHKVYNADNKLAIISAGLNNVESFTGTANVNTADAETSSANVI